MTIFDPELEQFAVQGCPPLPAEMKAAYLAHNGAQIWYGTVGSGPYVLLLHGGLGHSGNWGYQLPALLAAGYGVILIDTRGHGRSSRDGQPYGYDLLANDTLAVLQFIGVVNVPIIGWSDGAIIALRLAQMRPDLVSGVFFFACNVDPSGTREIDESSLTIQRCFTRHAQDYKQLSPTPGDFDQFVTAVSRMMASEPDISQDELSGLSVPFTIVIGENDEFIKQAHMHNVAAAIPGSQYVRLEAVGHFAPWQAPAQFNDQLLTFLQGLLNDESDQNP